MSSLPSRHELERYLLDQLAEDEADRMDELSVTDDAVAAELRLVEDDLVDAYVRDELDGPTRLQFESVYLTAPSRQEKVEIARALHQTLTAAPAPRAAAAAARPAAAPTAPGLVTRWLIPALMALVALIAGAAVDRIWLRQELNGAIVLLPRSPADQPSAAVVFPSGATSVRFELRFTDHSHAAYQAAISDPAAAAAEVWRSPWIDATGMSSAPAVIVDVPAGMLKPQRYTIALAGRDSPAGPSMPVASYVFERLPR